MWSIMPKRSLIAVLLVAASLGPTRAQETHTYTNSDVPTYRPRKKVQPKVEAKPGASRSKAVEEPKSRDRTAAPSVGRRPLEADGDPAFSATRPQSTAFKSPKLPGARDVFGFEDSAFQSLPERVLRVSSYDSTREQWSVYRVRISDIIVEEARRNDLDPLIIEIIIGHESAFKVDATSKAGACGLMQLMPETAASLGVTDIADPNQNVAAGTRYFAEQYRRFGNLHLALAAYNAGPGAVIACGGVPAYDETYSYVCSIAQEYQNRRKKKT